MTIAPLTYVGPLSPSGADFNNIILKLNEVALANGAPVSELLRNPNAADDVKLNTIILALNVVLATLGLPLHPLAADPLHPSGVQVNALIARLNDAVFETNNPAGPALPLIEGFEQISGNVPVNGGLTWQSNGAALELSSLHVTQGDHSALFTNPNPNGSFYTGGFLDGVSPGWLDLTGYSTLLCDFYITQADNSNEMNLTVVDQNGNGTPMSAHAGSGPPGETTLSIDISGYADKTQMVFSIGAQNGTVGDLTAYIDNLRATL